MGIARIERLDWQDELLADLPMPKGRMRLTRSLTSGLARSPVDAPDLFWGVGDRGPNIKPKEAVNRYGLDALSALKAVDGAKIMPLTDVGPTLAQFRLSGAAVTLERLVAVCASASLPLTGIAVPSSLHAEYEPVFTLDGTAIAPDPNGADTEGVAILPDGSFLLAEEYGPSLLQVSPTGQVIQRIIPQGTTAFYEGAAYPVAPLLPALSVARKLNRGFEGLALLADGNRFVVAFQSPLAHPDREAHETSRHVRLWEFDARNFALLGEYVYCLDAPEAFRRDGDAGKVSADDVKISEIAALGGDSLLVLERISQSTRIYRVALSPDRQAPAWLADPATRPTLEQMSPEQAKAAGVPMLTKQLLFNSDDWPQVSADLEGLILLSPTQMLLVNDSDFGIEGAETIFWRITFDAPIV